MFLWTKSIKTGQGRQMIPMIPGIFCADSFVTDRISAKSKSTMDLGNDKPSVEEIPPTKP